MDFKKELAGKKILYIEDDPYNRLLVRKLFSMYKIELLEAEDGLSGLEIAKNTFVDLILLDINMEGMNGYEIATRLRSIRIYSRHSISCFNCKCPAKVAESSAHIWL